MNPEHMSEGEAEPTREEILAALFANLVIQQTNTALVLLGRVPNPETGEQMQDLEGAKFFIDQLEMLEVKTKGNLDAREDQLLKQSLTTLRMAFVDAVESGPPGSARPSQGAGSNTPPRTSTPSPTAPAPTAPSQLAPEPEDSRKKFTKKY